MTSISRKRKLKAKSDRSKSAQPAKAVVGNSPILPTKEKAMPTTKQPIRWHEMGFIITHICNKNCELCAVKITDTDFKGTTKDEYEHILSCIGDTSKITLVPISGGEPLIHPDYRWLIGRILKDFPNAKVISKTNGKVLHKYQDLMAGRHVFWMSHYPGFNDAVAKRYRNHANVRVIRYAGFINPYLSPNYDDDEAKQVYKKCIKEMRFTGTKLYQCCNGEVIERAYPAVGNIHVEMNDNWREEIQLIEGWRACKHCFRNVARFFSPGAKQYDYEHDTKLSEINIKKKV